MTLTEISSTDYGYFVHSDDEIDIECVSEPRESYEGHRYYPICIGDVLAKRYRIDHKLGSGGFSTVWMAYDLEKKENIALKISTAGNSSSNELSMQKKIVESVQDRSKLLLCRRSFSLAGYKKAVHTALVFPMQGPSLTSYGSFVIRDLPFKTRMLATKQILEAIIPLHKANIAHRDNIDSDLKAIIHKARPNASETERKHALSVISRRFSYLPENRLSASELLEDPSFQALMNDSL
ncbi:hypothetical protein FQN57_004355 [Myotisia sp. PD_48]|nr:hypothetical protein FQN57_004355 [Myotisia sp. PD_48]